MGLNTKEKLLVSLQIFFIIGLTWQLASTSGEKQSFAITAGLLAIGSLGVGRVRVRQTRIKAELEIANALRESERSAHELASQLDIATRREIAFWIHGELQGAITAVGRSLRENGEEETAERLTEINDTMIRMMAHRLYPSQLEVSLHLALGDLCHERAELTMSDNLTVKSFQNLQSIIVPFDLRLAIYRIVEEAITNAEKKPDTTRISVTVEVETDLIHISVLDNGADFDAGQKHSLGFTLINTYVRQFIGHWTINNRDDGVLLTATLAMPVVQTVETMVPPTFASFKRDLKE